MTAVLSDAVRLIRQLHCSKVAGYAFGEFYCVKNAGANICALSPRGRGQRRHLNKLKLGEGAAS